MGTKYVESYKKPCKKIKWSDLRIGDYFFLETFDMLCLKISEKDYYAPESKILSPITDLKKMKLGEVNVTIEWSKVFDKE